MITAFFYINTLHSGMLLLLETLQKAINQGLIFSSDEYSYLTSETLMKGWERNSSIIYIIIVCLYAIQYLKQAKFVFFFLNIFSIFDSVTVKKNLLHSVDIFVSGPIF